LQIGIITLGSVVTGLVEIGSGWVELRKPLHTSFGIPGINTLMLIVLLFGDVDGDVENIGALKQLILLNITVRQT
jgi:hypothetical protein